MSLFNKYLQNQESLFKNEIALDPTFSPPGKIQFRESENDYIATCIKPLFQRRTGKNLIIYGSPGIGKTLSCKKVKDELEETTDEISIFYINLWKKNTQHKIILELCEQLDYKFTHNKSSEDLLQIVKQRINQNSAVFIFDEADKAESLEILYQLTEDIYRKTLILITNDREWIYKLDPRLKSRLIPDQLEFKAYTQVEIKTILTSRIDLAFPPNTFPQQTLDLIAKKTLDSTDLRIGLFILREAALSAESQSLKQITKEHVDNAIEKLSDFKKPLQLDPDEEALLKLIDKNQDKTTAEIFNIYQDKSSDSKSISTFRRKINNLEKAKLIQLKEVQGIQGKSYKVRKLSDF